jgi:predicted acyltransferase
VLGQIGLGYPFLFLLVNRKLRVQIGAVAAILIGYWLLFALYPVAGTGYDYAGLGITADQLKWRCASGRILRTLEQVHERGGCFRRLV